MADLPRMNDEQLKQARKLIRSLCCNYDNGSCLVLDWSFCNVCPQWISYSLNCKWFRNAVLPNDPALEASILPKETLRNLRKACPVQISPREILSCVFRSGVQASGCRKEARSVLESPHLRVKKVADTNDFFTNFHRGMCIYIRKAKIGFYMRRKLPV